MSPGVWGAKTKTLTGSVREYPAGCRQELISALCYLFGIGICLARCEDHVLKLNHASLGLIRLMGIPLFDLFDLFDYPQITTQELADLVEHLWGQFHQIYPLLHAEWVTPMFRGLKKLLRIIIHLLAHNSTLKTRLDHILFDRLLVTLLSVPL